MQSTIDPALYVINYWFHSSPPSDEFAVVSGGRLGLTAFQVAGSGKGQYMHHRIQQKIISGGLHEGSIFKKKSMHRSVFMYGLAPCGVSDYAGFL